VRFPILPSLLSALFALALSQPLTAAETRVYKKAGDRELKLSIVKPPDWKPADRRPALVFFHGGGWVGGGPTQFTRQAEHLAARGMVCIQVEYRLLPRQGKEPPLVCIQDAKSAMRWVRAHAAELGADPARIGAGGGSAGGHLAAFVGMVGGLDDPQDDLRVSPRADALVLFNPVFDNGPDQGWGTALVGERYREFSPAHNISADDPPAIVFLGTQDKLIPVAVARRFQEGMARATAQATQEAEKAADAIRKQASAALELVAAEIPTRPGPEPLRDRCRPYLRGHAAASLVGLVVIGSGVCQRAA